MEQQISFRDIQMGDYNAIKTILPFLTKQNEDFSLDSFTKLHSSLNSNHRIICCVYNDIEAETKTLVGIGTLLIEYKLIHNCSCVGHIEDIVVHEKYRNMNLGKQLINKLVSIAKEKCVYKVILNCTEETGRFYNKCGFHKSNIEMRINI
tara:strand:+ start:77 stop:526 length:450 start_codon:yes stop_codon:yes gene_type:complete